MDRGCRVEPRVAELDRVFGLGYLEKARGPASEGGAIGVSARCPRPRAIAENIRLTFYQKLASPKAMGRELTRRARMARGLASRPLPDFLVIGAQKAGTTSVYSYLIQHPRIAAPLKKQVHFFDWNYHRGLGWYRANFPAVGAEPPAETGRPLTFEVTPYYLFHPQAVPRIAETLDQAPLIVLLRNPLDRAYSHYRHNVRRRREPLDFVDALAAERHRLAGSAEGGQPGFRHQSFSYAGRSRYGEQLERLYDWVAPERVLVLVSEDLFADPASFMGRLFGWLGLEQPENIDYTPHNVGRELDSVLSPEQRRQLFADYFDDDVQRLEALTGRRFDWQ